MSALFIILVGIIIFLIGLLGLCGAQRESRTCLILVSYNCHMIMSNEKEDLYFFLVHCFGSMCPFNRIGLLHLHSDAS